MEGREEDWRLGGEEEGEGGTKGCQEKTNCSLKSVLVVVGGKEEADWKEEGEGEKGEGS